MTTLHRIFIIDGFLIIAADIARFQFYFLQPTVLLHVCNNPDEHIPSMYTVYKVLLFLPL